MSNDPLTDHLEMMSGMLDRHHNQPAAYFDAYELEAEDVVLDRLHLSLKAAYALFSVTTSQSLQERK